MIKHNKFDFIPDLTPQRTEYVKDLFRIEFLWIKITPITFSIYTIALIASSFDFEFTGIFLFASIIFNHFFVQHYFYQDQQIDWLTQFANDHQIPIKVCIKCHYDIRLLTSDYCPECGHPLFKQQQSQQYKDLEQLEWFGKGKYFNKLLYVQIFSYLTFFAQAAYVLPYLPFAFKIPAILTISLTTIFIQQIFARHYRALWLKHKSVLKNIAH